MLLTPALASAACSTSWQFTDADANHSYTDAGNWSDTDGNIQPTPPPADASICIKDGTEVDVSTTEKVADLFVDPKATMRVSGSFTVSGLGTSGVSELDGALSIEGGTVSLENAQTKATQDIAFVNSGVLNVDSSLQLAPDVDLTDASRTGIVNVGAAGVLEIDSQGNTIPLGGTTPTPTQIDTKLNIFGYVTNTGPVDDNNVGQGTGSWKLGSGDLPEPTVTFNDAQEIDGSVSDTDSGGLGHVVIATGGSLTQTPGFGTTSVFSVYKLDITGTGATDGVDISTGGGTMSVDVNYLEQFGGKFEVDGDATFQSYTMHDGTTLSNGGKWAMQTFHWGGGTLSGGGSGATYAIGNFELYTLAGDTGNRVAAASNLVLDVSIGNQGNPLKDGTITLNATDELVLEHNAWLQIGWNGTGADPDILGTGTIDNQGYIEKIQGTGTGTRIQPTLKTINGEIWVDNSTRLYLDQPPVDAYSAGVLSGTYILDGELDVGPGAPVTGFNGQFQLGPNGIVTSAGAVNLDTLVAGSTITVESNLTVPNDFTNNGTIDVQPGWSLTFDNAGVPKSYTQGSGALTKVNGTLTALNGLTVNGGTLQGSGTIVGDLNVAFGGSLAPGNSPGLLTINGNYTQSGILFEEVNGPNPGTDYDQLKVNGTATLGGQMVMQRTGGFVPANGQTFDPVVATNLVGTFASITQFPAGSDTWFDPTYSPTSLRLTANSVSIGDVSQNEGNAGSTSFDFTISLGQAAPSTASVDWSTQDGSATAGSDYTAASGTVTFAPGETTKTVSIAVTGDSAREADENFAVNLSNPVGTRIRKAQGVGTIVNDDSLQAGTAAVPAGDIDGFAIAPPPVQGKKVNVEPVSGKVLVKLPGTTKFIPLPDAEQVPVGTIVDATHGRVRLYSVGKNGKVQFADFYEGVFQVLQKPGQALTTVKLFGGSFAGCPSGRAAAAAKKKKRANSSVRHLWGSGKGAFQTQGRYASAAIRGTRWLTDDRCNGTLIRVAQGVVTVRDLTLRKTLALKAPKKYLAPAIRPKKR